MEVVRVKETALAKTTKKDFLKKCSPRSVAKSCKNVNSVPAVLETKLPTLATVRRTYGEDFTEAYVATWITNLVEFFEVGKRMGEYQIDETAMLIMQDYYMLTLADINLVFTRAKKGYYGEMYDRLDGAIILSWFRKYFEERCQEAASMSQREHERKVKAESDQRLCNGRDEMAKAFSRYKKEMLQNTTK